MLDKQQINAIEPPLSIKCDRSAQVLTKFQLMKKLFLAFILVSCQLVFAPSVEIERELTAFQTGIKNQLVALLEDAEERERETILLQSLNMENTFSEEERERIEEIATKLGFEKTWIYLVIHKESRGNPKAVNKRSGAAGLIQFLPSTAKLYGTTTAKLYNMTVLEQLDYVEEYFERVDNKYDIKSFFELYLSVFYPNAMGKHDSYIIGHKGSRLVSQNKGVDIDKNGILTVKDFKAYANRN